MIESATEMAANIGAWTVTLSCNMFGAFDDSDAAAA
jgi:hypothetical protein